MSIILLDQDTINKIAAGEVIERPMAVVKELVENSIDAGANMVTVEIKDGGKSFMRITDNGSGIERDDIELAFTPHATSKIKGATDLLGVSTLGFRGEALASVAAVSQLEMITKVKREDVGYRYRIDGGESKEIEQVGCPDGTTFIIQNLFYNTPARLKFLKSHQTEAGYIGSVIERLALSHPEISFRFINQGQTKLHTSGNGNLKDTIYQIYGRDITSNLLTVDLTSEICNIGGFIGKPVVSRGNRAYINYFINGRYIKSNIINRAIEEAYKPFTMQHRYPFTVLHFHIEPEFIDVNVHPQKMEIRFTNERELYKTIYECISDRLTHREFIPDVTFEEDKKDGGKLKTDSAVNDTVSKDYPKKNSIDTTDKTEVKKDIDEADTLSRIGKAELHRPDVGQRKKMFADLMGQVEKLDNNTETSLKYSKENQAAENINITKNRPDILEDDNLSQDNFTASDKKNTGLNSESVQQDDKSDRQQTQDLKEKTKSDGSFNGMAASKNLDMLHEKAAYNIKQETLFETGVLKEDRTKDIRIVGQVFSTYWILQYEDSMYMVDQHAAHEKVLYERFMKQIAEHKPMVQMVNPPIVLSLSMLEQQMVDDNIEVFDELGYKIESFGGREYIVTGIPAQLPDIATTDLLMEIIDDLANGKTNLSKDILLERVATMSCKAAVKGNNELPLEQAHELLKELMSLENPYNCPHGRPTMIRMSKYELEKKFKRVV